MWSALREGIEKKALFGKPGTVLAAVSGGRDSVALLHLLHFLAPRYGLRLVVLHVHHGLRGPEADRDALFVRNLAWCLGWPFLTERVDVGRLARWRGISIEMAAREARRTSFLRAARACGARTVALGHTADDQAETVLLRLARGTGPDGLGGMSAASRLGEVTLARPLLVLRRAAITAFLERHGIEWVEDTGNRDPRFLRNRVRHELLPSLCERLNPKAVEAIVRVAGLLRDDREWIEEQVAAVLAEAVDPRRPAVLLSRRLSGRPALDRRVVLAWLAGQGLDASSFPVDQVRRMTELASGRAGSRRIDLGSGRVLQRVYDKVSVIHPPADAEPFRVRLRIPGWTDLPGAGFRVLAEGSSGACLPRSLPGCFPARAALKQATLGRAGLFLRSRRPGDRYRPAGMQAEQKLQDLLVNAKVPRALRGRLPLVECRGVLVWIPGLRPAHGWAASPQERAVLLTVQPYPGTIPES